MRGLEIYLLIFDNVICFSLLLRENIAPERMADQGTHYISIRFRTYPHIVLGQAALAHTEDTEEIGPIGF